MTLTKAILTERLTDEIGLNRREGKEVVESFFTEISNTLVVGEEVKLSGLGNFRTRDKKERPGRNPNTGEEVIIQARRVVTFKTSQKLRSRVVEYGVEDRS